MGFARHVKRHLKYAVLRAGVALIHLIQAHAVDRRQDPFCGLEEDGVADRRNELRRRSCRLHGVGHEDALDPSPSLTAGVLRRFLPGHQVRLPPHDVLPVELPPIAGALPTVPVLEALELVMVKPRLHAWHALIEALQHRRSMRRPPIAHDETTETHLLLEVRLQQFRVRAIMRAIDLIVAAHKGPNARLDSRLKRRVVNLPGGALVNVRARAHAIGLLLVKRPMLRAPHDTLALHSPGVGVSIAHTEVGILAGHVLEVATIRRHAVHLHSGAKNDVGALCSELGADGRSGLCHDAFIPCCSQRQRRWPTRRAAEGIVVHAEAVASVVQLQRGDAEPRDGFRVSHVHPWQQLREQ
mmetsp:Transcript_92067/g.204340  ORF Transcript_92067/g.204340 Transcript_92067/m.204340 type:complete len:355 (+) Transcript_92067:1419-2483(+)